MKDKRKQDTSWGNTTKTQEKGLELVVIGCGFDKETFTKNKQEFKLLVHCCFEAGEMWEQTRTDSQQAAGHGA